MIVFKANASGQLEKLFSLAEKDVTTLGFKSQSIEQKHHFQEMENKSGQLDLGSTDIKRQIEVPIFFKATSAEVFSLRRDEIFGLFSNRESIYIAESNRNKRLITSKVYQVKMTGMINIERLGNTGLATLMFETTNSPYGKSILTTQQVQARGLSANDAAWSFGMGLETVDDKELIYTHDVVQSQPFMVFNAGNVEVHPFESYFKLTIKNASGPALALYNMTDSTKYMENSVGINTTLLPSQVWRFDGPNVTRNNLSALSSTNKKFISLYPGWNTFYMVGVPSATIEFDFNYLYR